MTDQQVNLIKGGRRRSLYIATLSKVKILAFLLIVLTLVICYLTLLRKPNQFYVSTVTGRVERMYALDEPTLTDVKKTSVDLVNRMFTMSPVNYNSELTFLKSYFNEQGFTAYKNALRTTGLFAAVMNNAMSLSSNVLSARVVLNKGVQNNGRYAWIVKVPVIVSVRSSGASKKRGFYVTLLLERVPLLDTPLKGTQIINVSVVPA